MNWIGTENRNLAQSVKLGIHISILIISQMNDKYQFNFEKDIRWCALDMNQRLQDGRCIWTHWSIFLNGPFRPLFLFLFYFQISVQLTVNVQYKLWHWLDWNPNLLSWKPPFNQLSHNPTTAQPIDKWLPWRQRVFLCRDSVWSDWPIFERSFAKCLPNCTHKSTFELFWKYGLTVNILCYFSKIFVTNPKYTTYAVFHLCRG